MRRIITFIAVIVLFIMASAQTNSIAMLDHDGELTTFDNVNSLEAALSAAVDGDKIYLSSGFFGGTSGITINKAVSIIGCGYDSRIVPSITVSVTSPYSSPAFVGVQLGELTAGNIADSVKVEISTCKIKTLNAYTFEKLHLDRCYINTYDNYQSPSYCREVVIKNSKISFFEGYNKEIVQNCNIAEISTNLSNGRCNPQVMYASIVKEAYVYCGSANCIMQYCLIGKDMNSNGSSGLLTVENCYRLKAETETQADVLDENLECKIDLEENKFLGPDGTPVGIYGGDWLPYTENPSLPAVDNSASSVTYDSESNQLKVSIKIKESETK